MSGLRPVLKNAFCAPSLTLGMCEISIVSIHTLEFSDECNQKFNIPQSSFWLKSHLCYVHINLGRILDPRLHEHINQMHTEFFYVMDTSSCLES